MRVLCRAMQDFVSHCGESHIHNLLKDLPKEAGIVTVIDGHPSTLTWLAAVGGHRYWQITIIARVDNVFCPTF